MAPRPRPPPDAEEQAACAAEPPHPSDLRDPVLDIPVVGRRCEEFAPVIAEDRAGKRAQVLDVVRGKPALDLGDRVPVFLEVLVLVA